MENEDDDETDLEKRMKEKEDKELAGALDAVKAQQLYGREKPAEKHKVLENISCLPLCVCGCVTACVCLCMYMCVYMYAGEYVYAHTCMYM